MYLPACVLETTSWCMSSYSTHYWCRACRKLATRNCLATSPRDTEVGLMASLLFCPFSCQQQPFCSLTGTISCGIAAVETKAVWLDGYHSEHPFPAPSLKEGCLKPVLGVWMVTPEKCSGSGMVAGSVNSLPSTTGQWTECLTTV